MIRSNLIPSLHPTKESIKECLKNIINDQGLKFKYHLTLNYDKYNKVTDLDQVIKDNERLRFKLRKDFKTGCKIWFFIEKHRKNPLVPNHLGYHRHILLEDPFEDESFESTKDEDEINEMKKQIIKDHIIKRNRSVPNENDAIDLGNIYEVSGLIEYLTKDTHEHYEYLSEVIDHEHSDHISKTLLDGLYARSNNIRKTRYQRLLNRIN